MGNLPVNLGGIQPHKVPGLVCESPSEGVEVQLAIRDVTIQEAAIVSRDRFENNRLAWGEKRRGNETNDTRTRAEEGIEQ